MIGKKLNGQIIHRILITLFCLFIGICVAVVMFRVYDPKQNSLRALASVCMDAICMVILLILIISFVFDHYDLKRTTMLFAILLLATIWAMFLDFLNWAFDGSLKFGHLTYWFTLGSFCMGSVLACIFSLYLYAYMADTHGFEKMRKSAIACAIINMVSFVLSFILGIAGLAFQFVDGHYETGVLYDAITAIPVLSLLYQTCFVIFFVKEIGVHDVLAAIGYILFMIAGALIEGKYNIGTTYVAVAIADIFIFVMLQNEIIALEKRNVEEWMKKSNTDELTGFYNRHAYVADLKNLESGPLDENFVYVSVDVNSLKAVNDSFGHEAGDELLTGAAECLSQCFGAYGKLYRTGGDEFIGLLFVDEKRLLEIKRDIEDVTKKWRGKLVQDLNLSCGYVSQNEAEKMSVRQMAILADQRMYEAKDEYYCKTGHERRRR